MQQWIETHVPPFAEWMLPINPLLLEAVRAFQKEQ